MPKITIAESDIRQALEGIRCPQEIKAAIYHEQRTGYLDMMVQIIIENGLADSVEKAIVFFCKIGTDFLKHKKNGNGNGKVNLSDLQNISNNNSLYKKLDRTQGKERLSSKADHSRIFGVRSHVTIPELLSGNLVRFEKISLERLPHQGALSFDEQLPLGFSSVEKKMRNDRRIQKIEALWKKLVALLGTDFFPVHSPTYHDLTKLLKPIFGSGFDEIEILAEQSSEHAYLAMITVLSWVPAVLRYYKSQPQILFKEVSLLPHNYDVGLGRIDALEVQTINGVAPDYDQCHILRRLARQRFRSVGHLIEKLVSIFGTGIHLIIHDWKFAAGDGDNGTGKTLNLIHEEQVASGPILKHMRQMERYTATSLISYAMVAGKDYNKQDLWQNTDFTIEGKIHYFLPTVQEPVVYTICLNEEERKSVFREQVVANYANAEHRSKWVRVSKEWLKYILNLVEKNTLATKPHQLDLKLDIERKGAVSKLIEDHREPVFVDTFGIVEYVGKNKKGLKKYKMRIDRLMEEIGKGNVHPDRFSYESGGSVDCFIHAERTGSMNINFKKGVFKCFGCGYGGKFFPDSIPESMADYIQQVPERVFRQLNGETEKCIIPDRHQEIMKAAQHVLQLDLLNGPGAEYLQKRALSPDLSWSIGAGYGSDLLIPYLIDQGFSYQEIIDAGFIGFSESISENNPLVQSLLSRGMSISELLQTYAKKGVNKHDVATEGLPYSILHNRVTYPLDIDGIITSFYGRSIDDSVGKKLLHRKTRCDAVPQGGFNITNAMKEARKISQKKNEPPQIGITESPIDVDTFFQHGSFKAFGGMVGTSNNLLYEILSGFEGNIVIAFDHDETRIVEGVERGRSGQRMTAKFVETVRALGFEKTLYDFTESFAEIHPEYKDINKYWQGQWELFQKGGQITASIDVLNCAYKKRIP